MIQHINTAIIIGTEVAGQENNIIIRMHLLE